MKRKILHVSTLLLLMTTLGVRCGLAQQVKPLEPEWLRQMYSDGWRVVAKGVLQRDTGGGRLETFSYGAEGLQRVMKGYEQQADFLEQRNRTSPSQDLTLAIRQLRGEIERLSRGVQTAPSADSFRGEALETCSVSYGGDAYAGPRSGPQGVTASASAYFHNDCGYQGDTFATAYAHAVEGSVETTKVQNDPKNSGTWIDSHASASANGSTGCESSAQGSATIETLGIYYQTPLWQNFSCPPPVESTSIYTLDSTAWEQTGTGNLGPLTLIANWRYQFIDSNYVPISASGLPQSGISFTGDNAHQADSMLLGQTVDTASAYASASVIRFEFTARFTEWPEAYSVVVGLGFWDGSTWSTDGGKHFGVEVQLLSPLRVVAVIGNGTPRTYTSSSIHVLQEFLDIYSPDTFRWEWTEDFPGSSTGTGQWWRRISGTWEPWGPSKANLWRPVGHAGTAVRIGGSTENKPIRQGTDIQDVRITIGHQVGGQSCQP